MNTNITINMYIKYTTRAVCLVLYKNVYMLYAKCIYWSLQWAERR